MAVANRGYRRYLSPLVTFKGRKSVQLMIDVYPLPAFVPIMVVHVKAVIGQGDKIHIDQIANPAQIDIVCSVAVP